MKYRHEDGTPFTKEEFLQKLKTDEEFNNEFGNKGIDQISELIKQLKNNPNSRRLLVSAWAVHDLPKMTLPPCHYGFQVYTRELSDEEQRVRCHPSTPNAWDDLKEFAKLTGNSVEDAAKAANIPTRAISLMWNQRSCDLFLGIPFNIASYGLLLEIIAKEVNMVPDELIGNLGDVHLYKNHIEQAKEQLTREPMGLSDVRLRNYENLESLLNTKDSMKNIQLWHYDSHPTIKAPLSN
jgi:thymidylate synthase